MVQQTRHTICIAFSIVAVAAIALLVASVDGAEAGGSGDYPPPASGDWYIYQSTSVWSEAITLRGDLHVYAPLSMNLVNLTMDCTVDGQYEIYVHTSGSMSFTNGNITAADGSRHYVLRTYNTTAIRNSEVSEAYYGIQVYTKQFTLTDTKVFDMPRYGVYMSLVYTLTGNVLIRNNEFVNNNNYGIRIYQYASLNRVGYDAVMTGDITVRNNKFRDNLGGGIYAYRYMYAYYSHKTLMFTNLTIEGNEMILNRGYSIYVYTRLYNYQGSTDGEIEYRGAINVNNNTIKENSGYYGVYYYNDIDVSYGSDALIDSDINMVGNVITDNKGAYTIYFNNNIYEYYGKDAKVRVNLRMEANNISSNGGHAVYVNSVTNTNHGGVGVCTNDGDIVFKDNTISDNQGSGVYFYRYAYSSYAAYSSITGDTTFTGNTIRNNQGYGGAYLYSYAYKSRGDANGTATIDGDVTFSGNTFTGNLGYGAYVLRYTRTYYGSDSLIMGDVTFTGNTINKNTGYGGYVYYDAYKQEGGLSGIAKIVSNATFRQNTMSGNSGYHGFYYFKYARAYSSSYASLNGTAVAEGNTIEDNKGYGIYLYQYTYNSQGTVGNSFITGDIWIRDNTIRRNGGGGVYLLCYASSSQAKSADIYQNITFLRNTVTNNGYTGFYVVVRTYSNRAVGGDSRIVGDIVYQGNTVSSNLYHGIYFYRYATSYYTSGTRVTIKGDIRLEGNVADSNYNYAVYVNNAVTNYQPGLSGHAELASDYIVRNNTIRSNLYWASLYMSRYIYAYYAGTAVLDSDLEMADNVVTGNRGVGVYLVDDCYQYYYGGAGSPERGSFTQKGQMRIVKNRIETNAGTGLHLNSTIDAFVRVIEPSPQIKHNSISYNGGDFGFYCDLRDITKPIVIENNTMDHNEVQYVALISNSGTAPDLMFRNNRIRHNTVEYTTLGLVIGNGDYNATFRDNNVSFNDAGQFVLAFVSSGRISVEDNAFLGNQNSTDVVVVRGTSNTSTIRFLDNVVRSNGGNALNLFTRGVLTVERNTVLDNKGSGIIATTDIAAEVIEAEIHITDNDIQRNDGNGVWTVSMHTLEVKDNTIIGNGQAGVRVNAMKLLPALSDNVIEDNRWGLYLTGDNLAPLTQTYTFTDLTIKDSTSEGLYAEDLTVVLRSCEVTGSTDADLAVRRARIDCYATTVGYISGHVYEKGHIKVWWRVDIDVEWQSGAPVPTAHVVMASNYDGRVYVELDTDEDGHIDTFNVEEWSMVDDRVNRWSPFRCTASKNTESTTQVETVDRSRTILITLVDIHVPAVAISSPKEDALLNASIVRVAGTANDGGSGLDTVRIRLDDGGWADLGRALTFAKLMPVPDGDHTITVQAQDLAGMLGNATVNITVDTMPPRLKVVEPEEGLLTNQTVVVVEGRVLEPSLRVKVNGVLQSIPPDNSFRDDVRLFEGPNTITVWAEDPAGNQRHIYRNVTLDTIPPKLTVDFPPDNHLTREPSLTVTGRSEPGARITARGGNTTVGSGGTFSLQVTLAEGPNVLVITASDAAGNRETVYRNVKLDTVPPLLTIETPEDGTLTRDDKVRVTGAVEDEEGLVLSVAGSFVLPVDGRYNYTVAITEGENRVVVTAIDAAGNAAEANVTVIRRTQPPILEVTRPSHPYVVTNEVDYRVEGYTVPDVTLTVAGTVVDVHENGTFSSVVRLQSGENVIALEAVDVLGNRAERAVRLILDTEPPYLVVLQPIDGTVTEDNNVTVEGRTDVGANVTIDGVPVAVDDKGLFRRNINLALGHQRLNVTSTDQAGNGASVGVSIERISPQEPVEPTAPPSTGGGTALILAALLVLALAGGTGYMLWQRRRRMAQG